jgi:hypothetical protein
MQKFFAFVGVVAVITFVVGAVRVVRWPVYSANYAEAAVSAGEETVTPRESLIRSIIWLRATLPRDVNDHTKLVAVGLHRDVFWSRFVLDLNAEEIDDKVRSEMRRDAKTEMCRRLRSSLQMNVISTCYADYVDRKRKPIVTAIVTKADCR